MQSEHDKLLQKQLYEKAKAMGLKVHNRSGIDKLQAAINAAQNPQETPEPATSEEKEETMHEPVTVTPTPAAPQFPPGQKLYMTEAEFKKSQAEEAKKEANRLVRVRVTCMNPDKKDWPGQYISVGSAFAGTYKKYIPFKQDEPYHIPKIIYEDLKERKCAVRNVRKTPDGKEHIDVKMVSEFAIDVLPPLSTQELDDLRKQQAMARGAG